MSTTQRRYLFQGNVQGVGFRMTTRRIARAHPVGGYVRNLPDGQVEIVASGEPESLAAFVGAVRSEFEGRVDRVDEEAVEIVDWTSDTFEIRT